MFYIFTFFSFLLPFIESNTLQDLEMLYSDESGSCFESLYLGDSKMRTQFRVTLQSPYNYIPLSSAAHHTGIKPLKENTTLSINNESLLGNKAKVNVCLSMSKFCIDDLHFYLINSTKHNKIYETLSFSLSSIDDNFSILHRLTKNNIMKVKKVSFVPFSIALGRVIFDDLPKGYINNKYAYPCQSYNNNWGCQLNKVIIGNNTKEYINKDIALFDTLDKYIYVPTEFFSFFEQKVINKNIENKSCWLIREPEYNEQHYDCDCKELKDFQEINFVFGNIIFPMSTYLLFDYHGKGCESLIYNKYSNDNLKKEDKWIFGTRFIHSFQSTFDFDRKMITFYTKEKLNEISYDKRQKVEYVLKCNFAILVIGGIICFVLYKVCFKRSFIFN